MNPYRLISTLHSTVPHSLCLTSPTIYMPKSTKGKKKSMRPRSDQAVLEGFAPVIGPDGARYNIPEFMIPATHQAFAAYKKSANLGVDNKFNGVSLNFICDPAGRIKRQAGERSGIAAFYPKFC